MYTIPVCLDLLQVNVVQAIPYDVDYVVYEWLVLAVLHPCRAVEHVANLIQHSGTTGGGDGRAKSVLQCIPHCSHLRPV